MIDTPSQVIIRIMDLTDAGVITWERVLPVFAMAPQKYSSIETNASDKNARFTDSIFGVKYRGTMFSHTFFVTQQELLCLDRDDKLQWKIDSSCSLFADLLRFLSSFSTNTKDLKPLDDFMASTEAHVN